MVKGSLIERLAHMRRQSFAAWPAIHFRRGICQAARGGRQPITARRPAVATTTAIGYGPPPGTRVVP